LKDTAICANGSVIFDTGVDWKPNYSWSTGDTGRFLSLDSSIILILTEIKTCSAYSDTANIQVIQIPLAPRLIDTSVCLDSGSQFVFPFASKSRWHKILGSDTLAAEQNPLLFLDSAQSYRYSYAISDSFCWSSASSFNMEVIDKPYFLLSDSAFCPEDMPEFGPHGLWEYEWSDGLNYSPRMFDTSGIYYLRATNQCGEYLDSSEIKFLRCALDFENAFSPNNDGLNDRFNPIINGYTRVKLEVFNRWGQRIFIEENSEFGWDGNFKTRPA